MTSRLPVHGLADVPAKLPVGAVPYAKLLPVPWRSAVAVQSQSRVELLLRCPDSVSTLETTCEALLAWARAQSDEIGGRVIRQIEQAGVRCGPVAGLARDDCHVMGIINVTPDSFSDGGQAFAVDDALSQGLAMVEAGATILDIGGESTRPGSDPVAVEDEICRVVPVVEALARCGVPLSIDSRKAPVMAAALDAGASIVNDVSALGHDPDAMTLVAERGVPVILMHALADPKTMQNAPAYDHVSLDIFDYLEARMEACAAAGIPRESIIVDPGIGFGQTDAHISVLMRDLALFRSLGCPILLGASRKSFIGRMAGETEATRRVPGSLAAALAGIHGGAWMLRVHDVGETVQALRVWRAIEGYGVS